MTSKKSVFGNNNPLTRPAARYLNVEQPSQEDQNEPEKVHQEEDLKHLNQKTIQKDSSDNHFRNNHKDENHTHFEKDPNHQELPKDDLSESASKANEETGFDEESAPKEKPIPKHQKHLKYKKGKTEIMEDGPAKLKESFFISATTMDRARNAVFAMPGATLSGTVEEALEMWLRSKERANGGPFPERTCRIKTGRPMSK